MTKGRLYDGIAMLSALLFIAGIFLQFDAEHLSKLCFLCAGMHFFVLVMQCHSYAQHSSLAEKLHTWRENTILAISFKYRPYTAWGLIFIFSITLAIELAKHYSTSTSFPIWIWLNTLGALIWTGLIHRVLLWGETLQH